MIAFAGAGGHCRSCVDAAERSGFAVAGFVDPDINARVYSYKRLGDDSWLDSEGARGLTWIVGVGQIASSSIRRNLFSKLKKANLKIGIVVAQSAIVSMHSMVHEGSVILNSAVINGGSTVGANCIINSCALIEHDCVIGEHCHISTGARINGGVRIGSDCFIGSGAVIANGVKIEPGSVIGAGSVVVKDVVLPGVWVGNPARRVR